jgi:hypothetical protein
LCFYLADPLSNSDNNWLRKHKPLDLKSHPELQFLDIPLINDASSLLGEPHESDPVLLNPDLHPLKIPHDFPFQLINSFDELLLERGQLHDAFEAHLLQS